MEGWHIFLINISCFLGSVTEPPTPERKTYVFSLTYRATVDCGDTSVLNALLTNIKTKIINRLKQLANVFANLCNNSNTDACFGSIKITLRANGCNAARRKKRAVESSDVNVQMEIPNLRYVSHSSTLNINFFVRLSQADKKFLLL